MSVNALVSYQGECISSHGTLSDATSHHAPAVWASLEKILEPFNLQQLSHLYIISDSPVNQYRNKNNAFLTKRFAVKNKIDITWVFMMGMVLVHEFYFLLGNSHINWNWIITRNVGLEKINNLKHTFYFIFREKNTGRASCWVC